MISEYSTHTLNNGLRIIHAPSLSKIAYCGFAINVGTRDEKDNESCMAHFIEHMMFKGTKRRKSHHINSRMINVGGNLNAETSKESTVVHCEFMVEYFERAVELLSDMVFHSTFPQIEIDREVDVILDEMRMYEDDPSSLILEEFENEIFKDHSLGRNILGIPEHVKTFTTDMAKDFVLRYYRPDNIVFFVVGNIDFTKVVRLVNKYVDDKYLDSIPFGGLELTREKPNGYTPFDLMKRKNFTQAHVIVGGRSYEGYNEKGLGLMLLNFLLGNSSLNSNLYTSLRERKGLVYAIESDVLAYSDVGLFAIYLGCDKKDVDQCLSLVHKELRFLREKKITDSRLRLLKKQLLGQMALSMDDMDAYSLIMGKEYLKYGGYDLPEVGMKKIEELTVNDLWEIANEIFAEDGLSKLVYV